jgi:hypothetical protein
VRDLITLLDELCRNGLIGVPEDQQIQKVGVRRRSVEGNSPPCSPASATLTTKTT